MRTPFRSLLFVAGIVTAGFVVAAEPARQQLEQFADGAHAFAVDFTQEVRDARGLARPAVHGNLLLQAPKQFRWHTRAPEEQLIVADGVRVWVYDPELEQVMVRRQSTAEAHSPLSILTDLSRLDADYRLSEEGERDGLAWLRLEPRGEDTQFEAADIGIAGGEPRVMVFRDTLGNESRLHFADWKRNPQLPADSFEFHPPVGVDVIGDEVEVPEIRGTAG